MYPHWRTRLYPERLAKSRWLEFIAHRLRTVEVNATFYSLTTPRACDRWRAAVGPDFVFAVKGSRYITHMKRLRDVAQPLANFFASGILRLGAQLGPILWQLPPGLRFDRALAADFFSTLPMDMGSAEALACRHDDRVTGRASVVAPDGGAEPIRYALEARHESWMSDEAAVLLQERSIALVWADTAGEHPATRSQTTRSLAYVRLHGSRRIYEGRYTAQELEQWASRVVEWARSGTPVFVYFDNDRDAAAAIDADRLAALIEGRSPHFEDCAGQPDEALRERPAHFAFRRRRVTGVPER